MKNRIIIMAMLLATVVFVSGCAEPPDGDAGIVMDSTSQWLSGEQGSARFPGGTAGEPVKVWKGEETLYWIAPIKGPGGLYIGNLITTEENFTSPKQIVEYGKPRERFLNYTESEAYQRIILESGYPAYQIERPILVSVEGEGLYWYSRVVSGGRVLDEIYLSTFTIF